MSMRPSIPVLLVLSLLAGCSDTDGGDEVGEDPVARPLLSDDCSEFPPTSLPKVRGGDFLGRRLAVEGVPSIITRCSLVGCPAENGCCNRCDGHYELVDAEERSLPLVGFEGAAATNANSTALPFPATRPGPIGLWARSAKTPNTRRPISPSSDTVHPPLSDATGPHPQPGLSKLRQRHIACAQRRVTKNAASTSEETMRRDSSKPCVGDV